MRRPRNGLLREFTIEGADLQREFRFSQYDDIFGRLVPPPNRQAFIRHQPTDVQGMQNQRLKADLKPDGSFHFDSVEPNDYQLIYSIASSQSPQYTLIDSLVLLPGAGDMDLGNIPNDFQAELSVSEDGTLPVPLTLNIFEATSAASLLTVDANLEGPAHRFRDLPAGPVTIVAICADSAREPVPSRFQVVLSPEEPVAIRCRMEPVTAMFFAVQSPEQTYRDMQVAHADTGQALTIQVLSDAKAMQFFRRGMPMPMAIQTNRWSIVRGVPPGPYRISAQSDAGPVEKMIILTAGQVVRDQFDP